jgi:hypothetical protein
MFARNGVFSSFGRAAVVATVAAIALTAVEPSLANAGSLPAGKGLTEAKSPVTDVSARRRSYRGGGAAAAFAGIVGTGLAIAASQNRRSYYDDYYDSPRYYAPPQHYYGGYGAGPAAYGQYGGYRSYGW